jgi:hypothetical protein
LMYHEDYRNKYGSEAIKCLQKYLWTEEIDRLRMNSFSDLNKFKYIVYAIFRNIFFYPYRYAFGTIKRIILKG